MDDLNSSNSGNEESEEPIPFDDDASNPDVSHSPLNLGSGEVVKVPEIETPAEPLKPAETKATEQLASFERITGVKTFFTKLHPGAMDFLDGQITLWLKRNPGVTIKRTNTVTGMVQGKKTEPNIIITVWY